jgi:predicted phage terminase large subunit-like protein
MTPTTSPAAYSDTDAEYAEALEAARLNPALYALLAHGLRPAAHHLRWLTALRETVDTPGGRLLLIAPPGSGKSSFTSLVLPPWYLGRHPDHAVLAVTSSDVMASEFSGVVELTLRANDAHRAIFPAPQARPDPARGWSRDGLYLQGVAPETKDPSYRCTGFGSSVIGSRANLLLLDDPLTQEMATSEAEMARARRYVDLTLLTRLQPQGSALCICTRFGESDLAAHLIRQGWRTEVWPQLSTDYAAPPEERDAEGRAPLWPARFPLAWVQQERQRLGTAQFELVHQGNPLLMGGAVWRSASWFRDLPPHTQQLTPRGQPFLEECVRCTYIDTAWSSKQSADYSAAVTCAYHPSDPARCLYVLGVWRRRIDADGLAEALAEHLLAVRPHVVGIEQGAYQQAATGALVQEVVYRTNRQLATVIRAIPSVQDKVTRARPAAAKGEAGLLFVDRELPEVEPLIRECLALPVGEHDDLADALSGAAAMCLYGVEALTGGQTSTAATRRMRFG